MASLIDSCSRALTPVSTSLVQKLSMISPYMSGTASGDEFSREPRHGKATQSDIGTTGTVSQARPPEAFIHSSESSWPYSARFCVPISWRISRLQVSSKSESQMDEKVFPEEPIMHEEARTADSHGSASDSPRFGRGLPRP